MRVLVVVPHYFHPEPGSRHSSVDGKRRDTRKATVERVFCQWRHEFGGPQAVLNIEQKRFEQVNPGLNEVTLVALTTHGRHLLDSDLLRHQRINLIDCKVDTPRLLGHETARIFADNANRFDLFIFSEDDLLVTDTLFLEKARWFAETFGHTRVLMPNRYEWNPAGPAYKTFIDGDLNSRAWERWTAALPDKDYLAASALGTQWSFRRARNPHSGMHVLTREQVDHCRRQPYWGDRDVSFIGPLESAATLGVLKTFSIYKSWGRSLNFFGVEHLDHRFSSVPSRPDHPSAVSAPRSSTKNDEASDSATGNDLGKVVRG